MEAKEIRVVDIDKIKTLGNKERLKILGMLERRPMSWTELQNELKINPNSLNFHLTKLLHSEFIARKIIENNKGRPSTQYEILPEGRMQYKLVTKTKDE